MIVKEELDGIDIDDIGIFVDGGELTGNINK